MNIVITIPDWLFILAVVEFGYWYIVASWYGWLPDHMNTSGDCP